MSWQLSVFLGLALVVGGGFWWYERARPSARIIALVAALAALAVAGRLVLAPVPNVVATTDIALITGYALGGPPGFAVGALAAPISNIWLGQGPWTVWQMAGWGLVGLGGAWLAVATRHHLGRLGLAVACALAGLAYGALLDLSVMVTYGGEQSLDRYLTLSARGIPFNVAHAAGNFAIALVAGPALVRMISRYRTRLEFSWRPAPAQAVSLFAIAVVSATALSVGSPAPTSAAAATPHRAAGSEARGWLIDQQNSDGGFGASLGYPSGPAMTGWVMLGLEAAGVNPLDVAAGSKTPVDYLRSQVGRLRSVGDLERTILALAAAGVDPRDFAGKDLIAELRVRSDGAGSVDGQTNLTAFYVLAMRAGGVASGKLARSVRWLRKAQAVGGGWGFQPQAPSDADTTGAVLQALAAAGSNGRSASEGARWLRLAQQPSGGYSLATSGVVNTQSTAWAVQGLVAAGGAGGPVGDALAFLGTRQSPDGHYRYSSASDQTPIWVTSQALMAVEREAFPIAEVPRKASGSGGGKGRADDGSDRGGGGAPAASDSGDGSSFAGGGSGTNGGSEGGGARGGRGSVERANVSGDSAGVRGGAGATPVDVAASDEIERDGLAPGGQVSAPGGAVVSQASPVTDDDGGGISPYLVGGGAFLVLALGAGFVWWRDE